MTKCSIRDLDLLGKSLFLRVDFNVPIQDGNVEDDTRIRACIPTLRVAMEKGARVVLASHLGRPGGQRVGSLSLKPVAGRLSQLLGKSVGWASDCQGHHVREAVNSLNSGEVLLLENLRFYSEETDNEPEFARNLSHLAQEYVNDAFGTAHRAHASTVGVPVLMGGGAAGLLMEREIAFLDQVSSNPRRPVVTILGGAKVSGKIHVIERFLSLATSILIGGGLGFTFLKASGVEVGRSLVEESSLIVALRILERAQASSTRLIIPVDVVIARNCAPGEESQIVNVGSIPSDWMGLDIGPRTRELFRTEIERAETIIWNGPLGVFEIDEFSKGTLEIAKTVGAAQAFSVVGGGDSVAAVVRAKVNGSIDHVSTGGGATLDYLAGKLLPGIRVLRDNNEGMPETGVQRGP